MKSARGLANRPWIGIGTLVLLSNAPSVLGQTIQFYPIRSAPLGSPVGTVGDPVAPTFNETLDCWELKVPGGVEIDIDVQAFGWGVFVGHLTLNYIQVTLISAGYDNGFGAPLNPKGWPGSPEDGAYQASERCEGDLSPCTDPFDPTCNGAANGDCVHASNWVISECTDHLSAIATSTLDYAWASAALFTCNTDDGEVKTAGGLILEVPPDAAGTYVIAVDPDPSRTFMGFGFAAPRPLDALISACITIISGACCVDTNSDGQQDACQNETTESDCVAAAGLFAGDGSTCSGQVGACCFDDDLDGFEDTCTVMDRNCCFAQGGSSLGAGSSCGGQVGACCLDSDGDGFADTCKVMNQTCCGAQGGSFRGAGSNCSFSVGACCVDDGTCVEANLTCCESQEGSAKGQGSSCQGDRDGNGTDDICEGGFPAVSQWGLIVLVLLLVAGIKIGFDRKQPA